MLGEKPGPLFIYGNQLSGPPQKITKFYLHTLFLPSEISFRAWQINSSIFSSLSRVLKIDWAMFHNERNRKLHYFARLYRGLVHLSPSSGARFCHFNYDNWQRSNLPIATIKGEFGKNEYSFSRVKDELSEFCKENLQQKSWHFYLCIIWVNAATFQIIL